MANYKLTNDYWEASGIYDIGQGKTQREINKTATNTENTQTVIGDIVTINDGINDMPIKNLTVNIEPVQDLHGYANPWPAGGSKNLLDCRNWPETISDVTISSDNTGKIVLNGTASSAFWARIDKGLNDDPLILPQGEYILSASGLITNTYIRLTNGDGANYDVSPTVTSKTFTSDGETPIVINLRVQSGVSLSSTTVYVMIRSSSISDSTWVPYKNICPITGWTGANVFVSPTQNAQDGTTYAITFPSEAGTVYGGTLDVTNGVLTRKVSKYHLGAIPANGWAIQQDYSTGIHVYRTTYLGTRKYGANAMSISDTLKFGGNGTSSAIVSKLGSVGNDYMYMFQPTNSGIHVRCDKAANASQMVTAMNGVYITYEYITPDIITLTPTEVKMLLGQNNIWADTGDVNVEYGAYLTVVENQLGEKIPKVAVAPIEKTTTASKAYVVNEMFFMGDKLYIATASIASGATFTVGTNCEETTLGAQLTALLNA